MQLRRAVLDANVLFSGATRHILLALATKPTMVYRPIWSTQILAEFERNFRRHWNAGPRELDGHLDRIRATFPDAIVDPYVQLVDRMPNHRKDRHVLATAVMARAPVVVTNNVRDFRGADAWKVQVQTPDDFLCDLYDAEPEKVRAGVAAVAGNRLTPTSVADLAGRLDAARLKRFAELLRADV